MISVAWMPTLKVVFEGERITFLRIASDFETCHCSFYCDSALCSRIKVMEGEQTPEGFLNLARAKLNRSLKSMVPSISALSSYSYAYSGSGSLTTPQISIN